MIIQLQWYIICITPQQVSLITPVNKTPNDVNIEMLLENVFLTFEGYWHSAFVKTQAHIETVTFRSLT